MLVLTPKAAAYVASEEGIVREAYRDSDQPPIWTWAIGVAATSGYNVLQWKDNPAPLDVCVRESVKWMESRFMPMLRATFGSQALTENQIAASLSFAWRNGTLKAQWVRDFLGGRPDQIKADWMNWTNHGTEVARAQREADLFCDGQWPDDLRCPIYAVVKPAYKPAHPILTDILPVLTTVLGSASGG